MKDPLPRIPFVTWQLPQDHLIFLSVHMREKRHRQRVGGKKKSVVQFPRVREGENTILLLCLSQSHIRSDHWRIKAHPDTSLPLSGGSWHALGTQNDSGGGAQDEEVFFWQSEREKGKTKVNLTYLQPRSTEPSEMKKRRRRRKSGKRQRGEEALRIV